MEDSTIIALASIAVTAFTAYLAYRQSRKREDMERELQEMKNSWESDKVMLMRQFERSDILFQKENAAMDKLSAVTSKIMSACAKLMGESRKESQDISDIPLDELFKEAIEIRENISDYHPGILPWWSELINTFVEFENEFREGGKGYEKLKRELATSAAHIHQIAYLRKQEHITLDYTLVDRYLEEIEKENETNQDQSSDKGNKVS